MKTNRRTLIAVAGVSALGATSLRGLSAFAQSAPTSPYTFPSGQVLTWAEPWAAGGHNSDAFVAASTYVHLQQQKTQIFAGVYDAPTDIGAASSAMLDKLWKEPTLQSVAGGAGGRVGPGNVSISSYAYNVYKFTTTDSLVWGLLVYVANSTDFSMIVGPAETFGDDIASAQSAVQLDGTGILAGIDGAAMQNNVGGTAAPTEESAREYTDATGNLHVTWADGWTVVSHDDVGTELANPEQTVVLNLANISFDGMGWDQVAAADYEWLSGDQGADAVLTPPTVTDTGYTFATDGEYGLRLVQATATADPAYYARVFTSHMEAKGADAKAILEQIQANITVNGQAPLQGLDQLIPM